MNVMDFAGVLILQVFTGAVMGMGHLVRRVHTSLPSEQLFGWQQGYFPLHWSLYPPCCFLDYFHRSFQPPQWYSMWAIGSVYHDASSVYTAIPTLILAYLSWLPLTKATHALYAGIGVTALKRCIGRISGRFYCFWLFIPTLDATDG